MEKIAALFPGQGSSFVGMYKGLFEQYEIVKNTIKEAEEITGINIMELSFKGPLSRLTRPENAHVAIVAFGVAAFRAYVSETGIRPQFCAGHSLGEYTALVCSGVLELSDALQLVQIRYQLSRKVNQKILGGMTVIDGIDSSLVEEFCIKEQEKGKKVYISCYNSDTQMTISGIERDLKDIERSIREKGGVVTPLLNSPPFHSPLMEAMAGDYKNALYGVRTCRLRYPVISNYTGRPYKSETEYVKNLLAHLVSPVRWNEVMAYLLHQGITDIVDFSANNIFENLNGQDGLAKVSCFSVKEDRNKILGEAVLTNIKDQNTFISKCIIAAVSTENFNLVSDDNNRRISDSYHKMNMIRDKVDSGEINDSIAIKKDVMKLLLDLFDRKGVGEFEKKQWFDEILDETGYTYEKFT